MWLAIVALLKSAILAALFECTTGQDTSQSCNAVCQALTAAYNHQLAAAKLEKPLHPLDPLTWTESTLANQILFNSSAFKSLPYGATLNYIVLQEPPKQSVLAWSPGQPLPPRIAMAPARRFDGNWTQTMTFYINLTTRTVTFTPSGSCNNDISDEDDSGQVMQSQGVVMALRARRLPASAVDCIPGSPRAGDPMVMYECRTLLPISRPIGLAVVFNVITRTVVQVQDIQADPLQLVEVLRPKRLFEPATIERPQGVSFKVNNTRQVTWGRWNFHVHVHERAGLVISQAKFYDERVFPSMRSVLYQGYMSEMFVPYMSPDFLTTYFDVGQYGLGRSTKPLVPLTDCPKNAHYISAVFPAFYRSTEDEPADNTIVPNAICIFERYAGDVSARHFEHYSSTDPTATKYSAEPKVTLVARSWATLGNYDYGTDWEFSADGVIKVNVHAAGYVATVDSSFRHARWADVDPRRDGVDGLYGTFVDPFKVGVAHDHFINFRLDLDVDGARNSFVEEKLVGKQVKVNRGGVSSNISIYEVVRHMPQTEEMAQYNISTQAPAEYVVINPNKRSRVGNPVGYKLVSHNPILSLLSPDDGLGVVAGFTRNSIWVTGYDSNERWSAGTQVFCYQTDRIFDWINKNRGVWNQDIVVWHTIGIHHIPVQEDWYLMPTTSIGFELKPHNFFNANGILEPNATPFDPYELEVC